MTAISMDIANLGPCTIPSPLLERYEPRGGGFVSDDQQILLDDVVTPESIDSLTTRVTLEQAGPRKNIHFDPRKVTVGIVTCGGLSPGLNDVVRGLVMVAHHRYGVTRILGFRHGYRGCVEGGEYLELTPGLVSQIHESGGSLLGSSRGAQESSAIVRRLTELGVNILFVVGGDGTLRGGKAIAEEVRRANADICVIGIPKTIDNDIEFTDRSFGFSTASATAVAAIRSAHNEARAYPNGIGLVKLMGRHSGFIVCQAVLASCDVNYALIPEAPFELEGEAGLLACLERRLRRRGHAVVVVAEGAGQQLLQADPNAKDASGNVILGDFGEFLTGAIKSYFGQRHFEISMKYIDPSYMIRSVPANAEDSVYCWRLAENAVHAAMCGKTAMVVSRWHGRFVHVPIEAAVARRHCVDPRGELWQSVCESTGQEPLCSRQLS